MHQTFEVISTTLSTIKVILINKRDVAHIFFFLLDFCLGLNSNFVIEDTVFIKATILKSSKCAIQW